MEVVWSSKFNFVNTVNTWKSVYCQKIINVRDNKLAEFNFKVLNNIVPTGYYLSKWNNDIYENCEVCGETESMYHMLFACPRIYNIWALVSSGLSINVTWKHVVCGYIMCEKSAKIKCLNLLFSVIMYAIFKNNNSCKFDKTSYKNIDVQKSVKKNIVYYKKVLIYQGTMKTNSWEEKMFDDAIEML